MKIRLSGTKEELIIAIEKLKNVFEVREVSGFYENRGESKLGRIYVDVENK